MIDKNPESNYGIICPVHGKQGLTPEEYDRQMDYPDSLWKCPICRSVSDWDDDRYEASMMGEVENDDLPFELEDDE